MVSEGYIDVLVRIYGRHMYCQSASLDMSPMKIYDKYSSRVQYCGDEDETNYETDEINKVNMNEF